MAERFVVVMVLTFVYKRLVAGKKEAYTKLVFRRAKEVSQNVHGYDPLSNCG